MIPAIIHHFKKGERVPDWLISVDPTTQESEFFSMEFQVDGFVVETDDTYYLLPLQINDLTQSSNGYIKIEGNHLILNVQIKRVMIPISFTVVSSRQG